MKDYCFGIDVGGTTIKCGLFKVDGELVDKWEIPTRTQDGGRFILPDAADSIKKKMEEMDLDASRIKGIGIGVPGPVNKNGEVPVAVNLHWGYVDIVKDMEKMTGITTKAANDANVAALGEMWKGGGSGYENLIMVTLGTGVGGGVIVNGKILYGSNGAGGEIGHAHVDDTITEHCNCGNRGCLEQVASATGIVRLAREELAASDEPSVLREVGELSSKEVFDALKKGDPVAERIVDRFGRYLGKTLAVFATVTDPQAFVIGGGVSRAGTVLLEVLQKYYRRYAFPACKNAVFVLATLGNDAGIYGSAKMVL